MKKHADAFAPESTSTRGPTYTTSLCECDGWVLWFYWRLARARRCAADWVCAYKGAELVDGAGQPLMLRGTNLGNWLEQRLHVPLGDGAQSPSEITRFSRELIGPDNSDAFWKAWRDNYITEKDLDRIAAMGFQFCGSANGLEAIRQ